MNCDTDLSWFDGIVACGLPDHGVTSLSRLLGREVKVDDLRPHMIAALAEEFRLAFDRAPAGLDERFAPMPVPG